ncbi:aminotransferase class V-fold PLP-dependent enzyme [Streptomyces sp. NBC_00503]|uniref:aminotransferase class V-fold PLP-dependent enzyme n=1 Tax=Streptomyces sp. NBC_00503 TaxID=2903659 RepID=UPI002E80A64B|nr:aminotransferase class V-fold PLP-dependent enzyme [Streptomyces sp. NBC_00503]WUD86535.1 aminotransferase class V-fold PLP-dependent enzyme [Streptomyces sp. NBC_00503]
MSAQTIHRVPTTHLNSAGTGRMPAAVRAVLADRTAQDDRGPYAPEESLAPVLDAEIHERLGALLGVPARRTALFTGAADAFDSYVSRLPLGPGDRIWTTPHEGVARLVTLHALRARTRCTLEVVPLREDGDLDLDWMREHLDEHVALVSVVHVSSACGTVNPVEAIGRLLAAHRALYAVDASHSVGRLPVDATRIGCELLTADGWRFLRGPVGTGFGYVAPGLGESMAKPPAAAAVAALNEALAVHAADTSLPYEDLLPLLRDALGRLPGIRLLAPGRKQSGIVGFRHEEVPAALIRRGLARRGVVVRKSVAQETPLHPASRTGTTAVEASVHHDNTPADIDRFTLALGEVLREERRPAAAPAAAPAPASASRPVRALALVESA